MKTKLMTRIMATALMLVGALTNMHAQEYITEVMTIGAEKGKGGTVRSEYINKGWTVLGNDLNKGAGGWDIYIIYKTSSTANPETGYITDICTSDKAVNSFTFEGRTYYRVSSNNGFNGDLNRGAGGADIFVYYTRDRGQLASYGADERVLTALSVTNAAEDNDPNTAAVSWRNSKYSGICDVNKEAGGDFIYIQQHFTTQTLKWKEEPTFANDLTFNGKKQDLITKNPWNNNYGKLKYRVNGGPWSASTPVGINVGNYTVEAYLVGVSANDIDFANNSRVISKTVTINPPIIKANNLKGVFNQGDKKVNLAWNTPAIPGNYSDFKWVVYRDGTKIAELTSKVNAYSDSLFTNESTPVYDVYYVSNFWDMTTRRYDTQATVTINTTRSVPVRDFKAEQLADRIVFTWTSDAYPEGFGHKFRIYVDDEDSPIYTLTPGNMQNTMRWEHRTTDQHINRQNKVDSETGVPYTEEPLNACTPHTYRIEGVIGNTVLNTYTVNPKAIGEATKFYGLDASKGIYEGSVKLSWHVDQQGSQYTKTYIVERRLAEQENEAWEVLTRLSSNEDYMFYTDETALPGVYYDYRITVEDKCSDGTIITGEVTDIGFAKSTGTVTGRIAYGSTGTAVQGVNVVMTITGNDGGKTEQFHSIYFSDMNGAVTWQYPSEDYAANLFKSGDFSIQMWLYPETFSDRLIADFGGGIGLGMTSGGQLAFCNGTNTYAFDSISLRKETYNHVALTRKGTTLTCYVLTPNSESSEPTVQVATQTWTAGSTWPQADVSHFKLGHFKGSVDEFRLWTKCLTEADIIENYDHLLVGDEKQLETYWTFDEGLRTQFFDYSRDGSSYRKHHGLIGSNAQSSTLTPDALKMKAKTDADGNYIIQGIPFTGEGTTYSVVPLYGVHEFNSTKTLIFVGKNALVHTADFEDVSSFPMSGYVYYAGTNVPAEGIMLYVDGMPVSKDGKSVMTSSNGYYNISVPIGRHYVEAKLESHKMVDGGRFPTEGTFYFDRAMTYDFADSTLVNFVGRVGGGERNDTLAVGFAESKNNIGIATIRLGLLNESFSLNCRDDDHITTATTQRTWQSDTTTIQSTAWTGIDYDAKYIYIRTDSLSGEFSALLPPLKYVVKSVGVDNNPDIDFGAQPEIDLTSPGMSRTDSLTHWDDTKGDSVTAAYKYNTKKVFTYYAPPEISITEKGHDPGIFGLQEIVYTDEQGAEYTIGDLWTQNNDSVKYLVGYPIYDMGNKVEYDIFGFERYVNHDGEEDVTDIVPLIGQEITIVNEMSDEQAVIYQVDDPSSPYKAGEIYELKSDNTQLGGDGHLIYRWGAGLPNIVEPYTRHFSINMNRKDRTYVPVNMDAVVLGQLSYGSNFVTKGPDHVDFVLRDPQGAKSTTKLKTGKITTTTTYDTRRAYGNYSFIHNVVWGVGAVNGTGLGFMVITGHQIKNELDIGVNTSWEKVWNYDEVDVETTTENVSTGGAYPYVGADGDVYVGTSTNFLIGGCRHLFINKNLQTGKYELKMEDAIAIGDSIATAFKYTQYELQTVMIPKWKDMRRNFFTEVASEEAAKAYVNNGEESVYLTWKGLDLDDYTEGTDYLWAKPKSWETTPPPAGAAIDSVAWCNNQIVAWETAIEENEKNKLELMNTSLPENISIDGGTSYSYSKRTSHSKNDQVTRTWKMGLVLGDKFGFRMNALATVGDIVNISTEDGGGFTKGNGTKSENYSEWEYSINDGNRDTDLSINIYKSNNPKYSDFFSVFGGQTYNPYQPQEVTQYYFPGTPLGNSTQQMEQPELGIAVGDQNSSKSVTVTDIPAGGEANVTLFCTNMANVNQGVNFAYNLIIVEQTNDKGLEILMDGVPVNGRSVILNHKETTKKVLTIRQTDQSVLHYEGIKIRFCSQYQPLKIYDEVTLNAHFVPSSSPVDLAISEPVLNLETMGRNEGDLELKVTNFNRQFKGMTKVGVEYRYEGSTTWTRPDTLTFLVNRSDSTKLHDHVLPATGDLRLRFNMSDDNFYPQGNYTFRAYTTTMYGSEAINMYSSEVAVVKDNVRPRNLTTPLPANGILRYGDDLVVEFNEDIVPGYISDDNIIVTAKLNDQPVAHDVSKKLTPYGDEQMTQNPVFLNGDFSVDFWMRWSDAGSILRLGPEQFALRVDKEGHIVVSMGHVDIASSDVVPKDEWTYFVLSYSSAERKFSALANYGNTTLHLFTDQIVPDTAIQQIQYFDDNYLYLGDMYGAMHDLALFSIYRDVVEAAATKNQAKDNYDYGLVNYWPMKEGHGYVAADTRHTHDFMVNNSWLLDNKNYALRLDDEEGVVADISRVNTGQGDSYAIEMWVLPTGGSTSKERTVFETGSNDSNRLQLYINQQNDWILRYGDKEQVVVSKSEFPDVYGWSHVALNVVRGQAASFYFKGQRTAVIAERDVPPLVGSRLVLGKGMPNFSVIDEVRIWHASLSESRLLANQYNCIDTADVFSRGLVAYYPFEKAGKENGVSTMVETLENMAPNSMVNGKSLTIAPLGLTMLIASTPPLKNAPVESRIIAKPVASERKIVIRLEEGAGIKARDIEGCTLNVTADKIHDMHGNESAPIRWTTYVQLNTLKWLKDSVNIIKKYGDDYTFDVNIENRGGNTEYYFLYNLPQWLTLVGSNYTDDIDPLKTKTLRFKVNPLVAVGNYDVTIGLQGNNEILEPLRIVMNVKGDKPSWSVNPNDYENNMSIVGQIYVNGILMSNSESILAAFIGDECRGIASPRQMRGAAYVAMSVYGNALQMVNGVLTNLDKQQPVTFRIWDAATGMTYTNVIINQPASFSATPDSALISLAFDPTKSYGTFDHPVIFKKSNLVEQPLDIRVGWNWISLGVEPVQAKTSVVLQDLVSWNAQLKDKTSGVAYSRGNYWAGNLKEVHANTMYKLQVTRIDGCSDLSQPIIVNGEQVKREESPVTIGKNWNWIAYTPMTTMPIGQALAGANPKVGDQVKSQTAFAYYGPYGWEGNLEALEAGRGYLYYSTDSSEKQFIYPAVSASAPSRRMLAPRHPSPASAFSPVAPTDYPDNMALVIILTDGDEPVTDAEVAAFIDGECRGTAFADEGLYYLLVAGEGSGQPIEIKASINGAIKTVCTTLTYASDGSIGTPWEPFVIDINNPSGINGIGEAMAYGVWYTLQGIRYGTDRPTVPGVYIFNGNKVLIK
ncbi:MAG: LamG domain-containing protein [Bacteroidaceae bacterium]|nr:LamG domain-containing protein [Bacteroidaceae bacterium]